MFMFVTDWETVMEKAFVVIAPHNKIPCREKWIGYISHLLTTIMIIVMESEAISFSKIQIKTFLSNQLSRLAYISISMKIFQLNFL